MALTMISDVDSEPISIDEAKRWLRVDNDDDDDTIAMLIVAARRMAQRFTRRAIGEQQWRYTLNEFPSTPYIQLPLPPLVSVENVQYIDINGDAVTMTEDEDYIVDTVSQPGRIMLPEDVAAWPATKSVPGAVTIEYICGEDPTDDERLAVLQQLAICYENRQAVSEMLLRSYRVPRF